MHVKRTAVQNHRFTRFRQIYSFTCTEEKKKRYSHHQSLLACLLAGSLPSKMGARNTERNEAVQWWVCITIIAHKTRLPMAMAKECVHFVWNGMKWNELYTLRSQPPSAVCLGVKNEKKRRKTDQKIQKLTQTHKDRNGKEKILWAKKKETNYSKNGTE